MTELTDSSTNTNHTVEAPSPPVASVEQSGTVADARTHSMRTLAILSLLMAFASISTDLYLPALPGMAETLHADAGTLEYTISGYLVGFSLGQLLWDPIGDRFGRKLPISAGLVLFVLGSAGCALSNDAHTMIVWRAVQAVGACASVVLARAIVRDLYTGVRSAQMMSTLITVMAIAPLIGPSVGSIILHLASWRVIFWTLVGVGLFTMLALTLLPETLQPARRNQEPLKHAFIAYGNLLRSRPLLAYAGAGGFFYGGIYAYIAGTPFAFIAYHHVSPQGYGLLFAAGIVGIMLTNQLNARYVRHWGGDNIMRAGAVAAALSGVAVAITSLTDFGGVAGLVIPLFVFVSLNGFIVANSIAGAMGIFSTRTGAVSALIGAIQYGTGIAGSAVVGALSNGSPFPMGLVIALMGIGSAVSALGLKKLSRGSKHPCALD